MKADSKMRMDESRSLRSADPLFSLSITSTVEALYKAHVDVTGDSKKMNPMVK